MASGDSVAVGNREGLERRGSWLGIAAHAAGNVLLGLALGIAVYYLVTDLLGAWRQGQLREELDSLGAVGSPAPDRLLAEESSDPFDLEGWEQDEEYWLNLPRGDVFGRLLIPRMDLDTAVVKGHQRDVLKKGPGWIDYTDLPRDTGNCAISGHRTTYGAPFRRLDEMVEGDTIDFYSPFRRYRYEVFRSFSVTPDRVDVVATTPEPTLTLTACDPPYSAAYRLIVQAKLVEIRRIGDESGLSP